MLPMKLDPYGSEGLAIRVQNTFGGDQCQFIDAISPGVVSRKQYWRAFGVQ